MTVELDLRDVPADEHRERVFDGIAAAASDDDLEVVADRDVDPHLVRYQIEHDRALDWEYASPDAEPRKLDVTVGEPLGDGALGSVDVRDLRPQRRHEVLLEIFDDLRADEGFVLVNDHDPKPLYHELRSMHGDVVDWKYADRGAGEWRVEVVKTDDAESVDADVVTRYDVREIPKQERHPTIHHRYGMIPAGGTMEIVAPHEPRPLHQEFRRRYGDSFTWDVVESEPGRCRVQITKDESVEDGDPSATEDPSASDGDTSDSVGDTVAASPVADEAIAITDVLDVRELPPAERHERIFDAYDDLESGCGFVLVNDHDPKPLYHQFEAEAGPEFRWNYRERDPGEFRVLIGKAETPDRDSTGGQTETPF